MTTITDLINWSIPVKFNLSALFLIPALVENDLSSWTTSLLFIAITLVTNVSTVLLHVCLTFYLAYSFVDNVWYKIFILLSSILFVDYWLLTILNFKLVP